MEACDGVSEFALMDINKEAKVLQKVNAQDRLLHISDDEHPPECMAKAKVEGERTSAVSCDVCVVDCLQTEVFLSMVSISAGRRYNADLSTGINQETKTSRTITNKEQATRVKASSACRH